LADIIMKVSEIFILPNQQNHKRWWLNHSVNLQYISVDYAGLLVIAPRIRLSVRLSVVESRSICLALALYRRITDGSWCQTRLCHRNFSFHFSFTLINMAS
jgi:hypothetical protein